jgi:anaerobic ribonucleoside-triphosphate reductase activating protein
MYIHNRIANSTANGPGERVVVWVQGCSLACSGCWNSETHPFVKDKDILISELADWILNQNVEGVTFSGGEPFQQAPALELLISFIKERRPELSIGSFTGYTLQELRDGKFNWWHPELRTMIPGDAKLSNAILKQMDFIIAGRYNQLQRCDDKPLCGSRNQEVHFLSARYNLKDLHANIVEMVVDPEAGLVQITGFPDSLTAIDGKEGCEDYSHKDEGPDDQMLACA